MLRILTTRTGRSLSCAAAAGLRLPLFFFGVAMVKAFRSGVIEKRVRGTAWGLQKHAPASPFQGTGRRKKGAGRRRRERVEPFDTSGALFARME